MAQNAERLLDAALQLAGKVGTLPASGTGLPAQPALIALNARQLDVEEWMQHLGDWYRDEQGLDVCLERAEGGVPLVDRTLAIGFLACVDACLAAFAGFAQNGSVEVLVQPTGGTLTVLLISAVAFGVEQKKWFEGFRQEGSSWGVKGSIYAKADLAGKVSLSIPLVSLELVTPSRMNQQVVLAHPSFIFMESLAGVLESQNYTVVGMATNLRQLRQITQQLRPTIIILEPLLAEEATFDFVAQTQIDLAGSKVVYLTNNGGMMLIRQAAEAGARAYLRNDISVADLLAALDALPNSPFQISPAFASGYVLGESAEHNQASRLTPLQSQIYGLIQQRHTNKEIARRLSLSESGVKYHLRQILLALSLTKKSDLRNKSA
jgi:two-component system nitrate/nitrite response regulator NarL